MFIRKYYVYILANQRNTVLYIGVTNNIWRRIEEHKRGIGSQFTMRYRTTKLVYVEEFEHAYDAICREKQVKRWRRSKKDWLINQINPDRDDLSVN